MKIRDLSIRNFRSFGDNPVTISFSDITSLVGANSSGKSNILRALDLFFNYSKKKISKEIFHNGDVTKPIEITITFRDLTKDELHVFQRNLNSDGTLRIKQKIWAETNNQAQNKLDQQDIEAILEVVEEEKRGLRVVAVEEVIDWLSLDILPTEEQVHEWWGNALNVGEINFKEFCDVDGIPSPQLFKEMVDKFWVEEIEEIPLIEWLNVTKKPTKRNLQNWWQTDLTLSGFSLKSYFSDTKTVPSPEDYLEAVENYWDENVGNFPVMTYEAPEKILGWANKLKGNLPYLIYIPAVRYTQDEIKVAKTNPFGILLNWLLGDIEPNRKEVIQSQINEALENIFSQEPETTTERRIDLVRSTLNDYVKDQIDIEIDLEFLPPKIDNLLSTGVELVGDDGYRSAIREKGQGVQRSVIFAVLRTYCQLRDKLGKTRSRDTIFSIEEPEICLHPAIKRATYSLLRKLSLDQDQVVFSTHDGYFMDVTYFDEVRVVRREKIGLDDWGTQVWHFPIQNLITDAKNRYGIDLNEEGIRKRFGRFYDPTKNEGFFAKKIVLVEGPTEEYSLPIYFRALGFDVDQEQVAVINAGSVDNLDYLYIVFNELGIPTYVIFDGDKSTGLFEPATMTPNQLEDLGKKSTRNRNLLKMFGESGLIDYDLEFFFPKTQITNRLAIFEHNFEVDVHQPITGYEEIKSDGKKLFGTESKPLIARYIAQKVSQNKSEIPVYIAAILEEVKNCSHIGSCLMMEEIT